MPRNEEVRFNDMIRGWVVVNTNNLDDKVLFKSDGMPTIIWPILLTIIK